MEFTDATSIPMFNNLYEKGSSPQKNGVVKGHQKIYYGETTATKLEWFFFNTDRPPMVRLSAFVLFALSLAAV